jgi:hypothetical protein
VRFDDSLRDREPESDSAVIVAARLPEIVDPTTRPSRWSYGSDPAPRPPVRLQNEYASAEDSVDVRAIGSTLLPRQGRLMHDSIIDLFAERRLLIVS